MQTCHRFKAALVALGFGLLGVGESCAGADGDQAPGAKRPPNIVVILADDLGFGEINCRAQQPIPTPHVASIAQQGVCFTNGYVTCPVCSPTRAGLLTGRYQQRFGHEFNPGPARQAEDNFGLPLSEITLADRLKKAGYATALVGKWHEGYRPRFRPLRRGFDEFFGFLGGAHSYVDSGADKSNLIFRDDKPIDEPAYLTDALGREAVAFIERHKQQPFFLYLAFNAVHAPLQTPDRYLDRVKHIGDEKRRTFAAMLTALDDNVGAVLDKLRQDKRDDNTLIFFISDNGGPTRQTTSRNNPLHGFKAQTWEGGIRVPYLVQWKGHLPAGKVYDYPVSSLDIVPTALAAAGVAPGSEHALDGVDLAPFLTGANSARPHESLYWRFGPQWAIRKGDLKLVKAAQEPVQLFDLAADVGEQHDLSAEKPEVVAELTKDYQQWNAQLSPPRWKGRQPGPAAQRAQRLRQGADSSPAPENLVSAEDVIRVHETRIAKIRETVAAESMDELIEHLNESISYIYPGHMSERFFAQDDFEAMLSNRRVLKLIALLRKLPKDEAIEKARSICDRQFKIQEDTLEIVLKSYADPNAPKNTQSLLANKLSFGAGVFGLAHFVAPQEVASQLFRLDRLARETLERIKTDKLLPDGKPTLIVNFIALDNLFKINVLQYSAAHGLSRDQALQDNMAKAIEPLLRKNVTLVPWDSETTSYDLTHVVFGKPVDAAADSETLTVYDFDAFMCADGPKQRELVKQLVQICGGIK